jgi:hypothetical protein
MRRPDHARPLKGRWFVPPQRERRFTRARSTGAPGPGRNRSSCRRRRGRVARRRRDASRIFPRVLVIGSSGPARWQGPIAARTSPINGACVQGDRWKKNDTPRSGVSWTAACNHASSVLRGDGLPFDDDRDRPPPPSRREGARIAPHSGGSNPHALQASFNRAGSNSTPHSAHLACPSDPERSKPHSVQTSPWVRTTVRRSDA